MSTIPASLKGIPYETHERLDFMKPKISALLPVIAVASFSAYADTYNATLSIGQKFN